MKLILSNLTKGKLYFIVLTIILIVNDIIYHQIHGCPFDEPPREAWQTMTGMSMAFLTIAYIILFIFYIIEHWNTPLNEE